MGEGQEAYLFNSYCKDLEGEKPFPYVLPETVTLRNVRTKSGKPVQIFADERYYKGVKVIIED